MPDPPPCLNHRNNDDGADVNVNAFVFPLMISGCSGNPDAKRLYDDLLSNYNKLVRPVVNVTDALTVKIKLKLSQLIDVVNHSAFFFFSLNLENLFISKARFKKKTSFRLFFRT